MKNKLILKIGFITILSVIALVPITRSYFFDTEVITGNVFSTGYWEEEKEELIIELKKPLDKHTYFLGQEIQILWKVKNAHPHSEFNFKIFLFDENRDLIQELDMSDMECGPPAKAPVYEKWCKWEPEETGDFYVRVEGYEDGEMFGFDENEDSFTINEKPGKKIEPELQSEPVPDQDSGEPTEEITSSGSEPEIEPINSSTELQINLENDLL